MPVDEFWKTSRGRRVRAVTALSTACLLPFSALADPPLPLLKEVGFLGRWAISCEAPASPRNVHITYYDGGNGQVGRRVDRGAGPPALEGKIDSATLLAPGRLAITVRNVDANWQAADGMIFETEVELEGNRARTVRSVANTGTAFIVDGKMVDGRPVPTLTRCAESRS